MNRSLELNKFIAILLINIFCLSIFAVSPSKAEIIEPVENQYIEFRAVNLQEIDGKDKQLIVEVWSHNLDIKGFDIRYQYDNTVISHSNILTNEYTDDKTQFFEYSNGNENILDLFSLPEESATRLICSLLPEENRTGDNEKIVNRGEQIGDVLDTKDGFLIGKLSFRTSIEAIPSDLVTLKTAESSPTTGIKVNFNGVDSYEAESLFRFTDATASKNASLSNLVLSSGQIDEVDPENSTYKEYTLTPEFNKDTLNYELELLEYLDKMDITATKSDEKSTMKIKVPKRDENNNLVYDSDGTTIIYEEREIQNGTKEEITINKLGEPNTNITVIVTAEDGKTTNEYKLVIKRPYGVIKGKIRTSYTEQVTGNHICKILVYDELDVQKLFGWDDKISDFNNGTGTDTVNEELHSLVPAKELTTNNDGTYELKLIPGQYDVLADKPGYLDQIYIYIDLLEGDTIDLGSNDLIAGDCNKDGIVQIKDKVLVANNNGKNSSSTDYDEAYDFNNDGEIQIKDKVIVTNENGKKREIINWKTK